MGKIYRFLSVLSLAICLSASVVVPSISFAEEDCGRDCKNMSQEQMENMAYDLVYWGSLGFMDGSVNKPFYEEMLERTYCNNCYNNVKKISEMMEKIINENGYGDRGGCMDECLSRAQGSNFRLIGGAYGDIRNINHNTNCNAICENAQEQLEEIKEQANECHSLAGWQDSNHWGITNFAQELFTAGSDHWFHRQEDANGGLAVPYAKTLNTFLKAGNGSGCWFCPIFDIVFNSINKLGTLLYIKLRSLCLALLAIFGFAWILWTVFKLITTIHGPNIGEFATKVFKNLLLWSILAIILWQNPSFITRYVIDPFAALGTQLSTEILKAEGFDNDTVEYTEYSTSYYHCGMTTIANHSNPQKKTKKVCERNSTDPSNFFFTGTDNESIPMALSADVYEDMNCMLRRMSLELIGGMALGAALISEGMTGGGNFVIEWPQWSVLAVGILIFISFFALFISVPLKLIDLLLRLGFVIVLLPVFIACIATPVTREYSKKGWEMFISCWISLISLFLFLSLALMLVNSALLME